VRAVLRGALAQVPVARARTVVGVAGTITSLAHLQLGLTRYTPERTHRSRLTLTEVETLYQRLSALPNCERRAILADPKRAEVIAAGALILRELLAELPQRELLASERDILDGLATSLRG
jgi:exopolyphosphatase/guanosine-5'-triphosphate,3'-diphosphate pyrophosphatase